MQSKDRKILRLISYNVHAGFNADGEHEPAAVAEVLSGLEWDMVLMQELDRHTRRNLKLDLITIWAMKLGCAPIFCSAMDFDDGLYGIGALVRHAISDFRKYDISVLGAMEPRVAMALKLSLDDSKDEVWVVNTHFGLEIFERREQTEMLLDFVEELNGKVIIAGDFNVNRGDELQPLLDAGFAEVPTGNTFPSFSPTKRLDRMFYSRGVKLLEFETIDTETTTTASDHLPIRAVFEI